MVAKKASVHVPRTAPWRDQSVTEKRGVVREASRELRSGEIGG
jgi:hypothetical protein